MLRLDFYESGPGETIIVTFPSGGIGIVDAHPSPTQSRPKITELVSGRQIHFICLTHPHADHGRDLTTLLTEGASIEAFWHTLSQVDQFFYGATQTTNFPTRYQGLVRDMQTKWAEFLIDLFGTAASEDLNLHQLCNNQKPVSIDGVEIHVLSPDEQTYNDFTKAYQARLENPRSKCPDPNRLSAVLALRYGQSLVLLGGDALKQNWVTAGHEFLKAELPRAGVLKVPHHGAHNALLNRPKRHERNYFDLCHRDPPATAVVFPGDVLHPHPKVYEQLLDRTVLYEVGSGRYSAPHNPLGIDIPGARALRGRSAGNSVVSLEIAEDGETTVVAGMPVTEDARTDFRP